MIASSRVKCATSLRRRVLRVNSSLSNVSSAAPLAFAASVRIGMLPWRRMKATASASLAASVTPRTSAPVGVIAVKRKLAIRAFEIRS